MKQTKKNTVKHFFLKSRLKKEQTKQRINKIEKINKNKKTYLKKNVVCFHFSNFKLTSKQKNIPIYIYIYIKEKKKFKCCNNLQEGMEEVSRVSKQSKRKKEEHKREKIEKRQKKKEKERKRIRMVNCDFLSSPNKNIRL